MLSWKLLIRVFIFLLLNLSFIFSQTWYTQTSGVTSQLQSVYFANSNTGWVGTVDGDVLKTTNSGTNWLSYSTGQTVGINSLYFISATAGFACCDLGYILVTSNGGLNWSTQVSSTSSSLLKIRFINSSTGWAAGDFRTIVRTTNSGTNWITQLTGSNAHYSIFPVTATVVLACGYDGVINKSTTGGLTWFSANSNVAYVLNDIYFPSLTTGIAVGYGTPIPTILRSTNAGDNWSIVSTASGSGLNAIHFPTASSGWACGYGATVMFTSNSGANWVYQDAGVPGMILKDIFFVNSTTGWSVGTLGTIIKTTTGGITAVQQTGTEVPENYSLSQNYPNPFNPSTNIKFAIRGNTVAQTFLSVYDILGNEVAVLINQNLQPGEYEAEWNASAFPSGVYYYKLQAWEYSETKKMILLK